MSRIVSILAGVALLVGCSSKPDNSKIETQPTSSPAPARSGSAADSGSADGSTAAAGTGAGSTGAYAGRGTGSNDAPKK